MQAIVYRKWFILLDCSEFQLDNLERAWQAHCKAFDDGTHGDMSEGYYFMNELIEWGFEVIMLRRIDYVVPIPQ